MYSRILVPLDGSAFAAQALPYATLIAGRLNAAITLFQAAPTLVDLMRHVTMRPATGGAGAIDSNATRGVSLDEWQEMHRRVRKETAEDLERNAVLLRSAGLSVATAVGEGDPAEAIAQEADSVENTLIAMTTHGRSGISRWWAGSVTDKTLRMTQSPMLVIRCEEEQHAPSQAQVQRIILPLDGSPLAELAIPHASALANALGAGVHVLRVRSQPYYFPAAYPLAGAIPSPGSVEPEAGEYVERIAERLRTEGAVGAEAVLTEGDAATIITEAAETAPHALVVMSTHGRSGIGRWVMGSVADKVVRQSGQPVLLIRAEEEAGAASEAA